MNARSGMTKKKPYTKIPLKVSEVVFDAMDHMMDAAPFTNLTDILNKSVDIALAKWEDTEAIIYDGVKSDPFVKPAGEPYPEPKIKRSARGRPSNARRIERGKTVSLHINVMNDILTRMRHMAHYEGLILEYWVEDAIRRFLGLDPLLPEPEELRKKRLKARKALLERMNGHA